MKKVNLCSFIAALSGGCALLAAPSSQAAVYLVTVDTSSLVGNANAPFALDFSMTYGSGPFGNNAIIGNFSFGGGAATAGTVNTAGAAAGDLNSSVTLSDDANNFYNDLNQQFTPGSTLSFYVALSNNKTINTPDGLSFAILDYTGGQIPTTQPTDASDPQNGTDGTDLVDFAIGGDGLVAQQIYVFPYAGANNPDFGGDYTGVSVSVVAVPEPSNTLAGLAGLGFALIGICRKIKPGIAAA